jgi:2-succinyl-5-enolpyruvyl-6-hydroxy-3-cyclohexene-1-carboxylate synthase
MSLGDVSLACAWALVDRLASGGVRDACVSPGSRSTPLALALSRHPAVHVHVHLDERSSAFFALGIAKATMRPVVVATTSGTAAAELLPAIVEASQSRVPLVALTADRPPRLRGTGANQTIDQHELFGRYVRTFEELPAPADPTDADAWAETASRALAAIREGPAGPVHVNCPFDEPLTPAEDLGLPPPSQESADRAPDETPVVSTEESDRFVDLVSGRRGVLVIGGWPTNGISDVGRLWTDTMGWPVLAEPQSGARVPGQSLTAGLRLISDETWLAAHRPDVIVQLGAAPTSRATQSLVASVPDLVVADRFYLDPDPDGRATLRLHVDPELPGAFDDRAIHPAPEGWVEAWREADEVARHELDAALDGTDRIVESRVARDVAAWIPDGGTLFVGNSSPVRDLDLAMAPRTGLRVLANRGASGIDGLVSTAFGIASTARGPTYALLGDLSLLYDVGSLLWNGRRGISLVLVVLDNGGGRVFERLPQRELPEFRDLFLTPHDLELGAIAGAAGGHHQRVERADELLPALERATGGTTLLEVAVGA